MTCNWIIFAFLIKYFFVCLISINRIYDQMYIMNYENNFFFFLIKQIYFSTFIYLKIFDKVNFFHSKIKWNKSNRKSFSSLNCVIVEEKRYGPDGSAMNASMFRWPLFHLVYKVSAINQIFNKSVNCSSRQKHLLI